MRTFGYSYLQYTCLFKKQIAPSSHLFLAKTLYIENEITSQSVNLFTKPVKWLVAPIGQPHQGSADTGSAKFHTGNIFCNLFTRSLKMVINCALCRLMLAAK